MKKIALAFVMATLGLGLCACDEGEYNDLKCDPATYKANCLDPVSYMVCVDNLLILHECPSGQICSDSNATADNVSLCK